MDNKETCFMSEKSSKTVGNPFYPKSQAYKNREIQRSGNKKGYRKLSQESQFAHPFDATFGHKENVPIQPATTKSR